MAANESCNMKNLFIRDLTKGQSLDDFFVGIRELKEAKDRNGNIYYDLELMDNSGVIKGKIWSNSILRVDKASLETGKIVKITGEVGDFRGVLQITIDEMFEAKEDEIELENFLQMPSRSIDVLWEEFSGYIEKVESKEVRSILDTCLEKYGDELKKAPAAERLHHAYTGGLLEHLTEMLGMMDKLKGFYPEANYDIITAGIVFHDLGKTRELAIDGFGISRTDAGKLIGHISLGLELFLTCIPEEFDEIIELKIKHIILSHHGMLEYGSPVVPKTMEAIIVHEIDDLSSKVRQVKRIMDESEEGSDYSRRDWALGTEFYLK